MGRGTILAYRSRWRTDAQGTPLIAQHTLLTALSIQVLQLMTRQQRQRLGSASAIALQAVKAKMGQASLIHFATHGLIDYGQQQGAVRLDMPGALAFAPGSTGRDRDGLLAASEILYLQLKANLVVLSACDTGRGNITSDSAIGLSRAFISAGTPSAIVWLWALPDAPTASLMQRFYQEWQGTGDKAQALRQAMLATRENIPIPEIGTLSH